MDRVEQQIFDKRNGVNIFPGGLNVAKGLTHDGEWLRISPRLSAKIQPTAKRRKETIHRSTVAMPTPKNLD
jgi:hypothetical protein